MNVVLRITRPKGTSSPALLKIEGKVVGVWAGLLERECMDLLRSCSSVTVDLAEVPLVDRAGVEALGRLSRAGAWIRCRRGAVASVLEAEGVHIVRTGEGDEQA
ncbi:MAG TPA: hypothetical protein VNI57_01170 [Candidatus Saccharimonadales bacterium]|nr:hypothetical protein [Candidatus Saccharimonadales bacterium]